MSRKLREALASMAQLYGRQFSAAAADLLVSDLSDYSEEAVMRSLARCRKELRGFPTPADIIARIEDGHPGPEEAWAMLPEGEEQTVVWTPEIREAYSRNAALIADDRVAGRMAFRETYAKLLSDARATGKPAKWEVSLGHDPEQRERALQDAVRLSRISQDEAKRLLPYREDQTPTLMIGGPVNDSRESTLTGVGEVIQRITGKPKAERPESRVLTPEEEKARREELRRQARRLK